MNEDAKKQTLLMIPYGLYVVGVTGPDGSVNAFTANWLSQASFKPPLIMMAVKTDSRSYPMIRESKSFAVSFLESGQKEIAAAFFKPPELVNGKLGGHAVEFHETGAPVLAAAPAFVECAVTDVVDRGDHAIFVAQVTNAGHRRSASPLLMSETGWKYGG